MKARDFSMTLAGAMVCRCAQKIGPQPGLMSN
jgi:hypothetical protein